MEDAPLNLAHYYARRAERHLKHHKYDDAIINHQKSIFYIGKALEKSLTTKGKDCLQLQFSYHEKQIEQIEYKKFYYQKLKRLSTVETASLKSNKDIDETNTIPTTLINTNYDLDKISHNIDKNLILNDITLRNNINDRNLENHDEENDHLEKVLNEIPKLAPLELPLFDLNVLQSRQINTNLNSMNLNENDENFDGISEDKF